MNKRFLQNCLSRIVLPLQLPTLTPALLFVGMSLAGPLHAQVTTGTLGGTVTDTTGAVIPKAAVTLQNEASGDFRKTVSNGSGVFSLNALPVGTYTIKIESQGFSSFQQTGIHLDPGDSRTVREIKLTPGGESTTVEVTSASGAINLDSGEQSSLISAEDISHLSVQGRDVTELLKILPGFAISRGGNTNAQNNASFDPSQVNVGGGLGQYAANGTPVNGQALLSDGVDITDPGNFGQAIQNVNYEQVAEVKVTTSSFTADTAHGPIVINAVGKSGGDHFHGSLYTYARTYQLNSTDSIAKASNQAKPNDRYVYPGFTFGGPVLIPFTSFNKSRKLTFFLGAEDYAQRNAYAYGDAADATLTALVPTANMKKGIFNATELQSYLGTQYGIDPAGGACTYNGSSTGNVPQANVCRVPVTAPDGSAITNGNIAPYFDPLGKILLQQMPDPNRASNGIYNRIDTNLIRNDIYQLKGRVDLAANSNNHLFAQYGYENGVQGVPQNEYYSARGNEGGLNIPGGGLLSKTGSHIASLNYAHVFSPSFTNEFYAGGAYFKQNFIANNQAAIANNPYQGIFANGSIVQPTLEDYGYDGLPLLRTPDTSFGGIFAVKQVRIAGDNLTKTLGKHTFKAGVFYQFSSNPQVAPFINTNGTINAYYIPESLTDPLKGAYHATGPVGSGNGGNYLADVAEGFLFQYSQTNIAPEPNLYFWNLSGYVQDHWRVSSRLTLDFGVRLEHLTPWQDSHNIGLAAFTAAAYAAKTNTLAPGISYHAMDSSVPNAGRPTRAAFVNPRGGFALDIYGNGGTIMRGGAGIYRAHDAYNDAYNQNQTTLGLRTATLTLPGLLSSISTYRKSIVSANGFVADSNVYAFDPTDDEEPRVVTYNLAVDQRLPGKMLLEIAYVGNRSDKLLNDGSTANTKLDNINTLPIGSLFKPLPNTRPDLGLTTGTVFPIIGPPNAASTNSSIGNLSQGAIDAYKNFPLYNQVYVPEHNTYANYNALQVGLTKQTGHSVFNINYTFSKALGVAGIGGSSTYSYPADPFNYQNDYTFESFDRRNIFNASYSYTVGKVFANRFADALVDGFEFSGISTYQSGANLPSTTSSNFGLSGQVTLNVGATANIAGNNSTCVANPNNTPGQVTTCNIGINAQNLLGTPDFNLQPTLIGDPTRVNKKAQQYVNGSALGLALLGQNGPPKLGHLPGPGFFDTDLTAARRFKTSDKTSVQLRVAAFNFINHANNSFNVLNTQNYTLQVSQSSNATSLNQALAGVNAATSNPQFGYAPLTEGRRTLELALRFDF